MAPRETENNAIAKFWADKQRTLWYVMVFSGVVNCQNGFWGFTETYVKAISRTLTATPKGKNRPPIKKKNTYTNHCASVPRKIQSLFLVWTILYIIAAKFQPIGTGVAKLTNHIEVWLHDLVSWKKKRVDSKISNWFKLNQLDQTFKQTVHFIKHSRGK